ncbi:hypothetical protein VSR34_21755 [Paraburkholderia sp. JHI2823]|uniref:hypothetical protein n=1 Tax=Paraburkholderia sp. JHI2823 TaxID=3112960 RepID=UPI00317B8C0A
MHQRESLAPDAAEFLSQRRQRKRKLEGNTDLIVELLAKGFTRYMVWRYLVERREVDVCLMTVLRFIQSLPTVNQGGASPSLQSRFDVSNLAVVAESRARPLVEASLSPGLHASSVESERGCSSEPDVENGANVTSPAVSQIAGEPSRQETSQGANNEETQPVFVPGDSQAEARMSAPNQVVIIPEPGIVKYDSLSREHRERERAMRFPMLQRNPK